VKAIRPGPFGTAVIMNDSLAARRIILEQTGRLKQVAGVGDLARLLADAWMAKGPNDQDSRLLRRLRFAGLDVDAAATRALPPPVLSVDRDARSDRRRADRPECQ
jgi:hypothetical protein